MAFNENRTAYITYTNTFYPTLNWTLAWCNWTVGHGETIWLNVLDIMVNENRIE